MAANGERLHHEAYKCLRDCVQNHVALGNRPQLQFLPIVYGGLEGLQLNHPYISSLIQGNKEAVDLYSLSSEQQEINEAAGAVLEEEELLV